MKKVLLLIILSIFAFSGFAKKAKDKSCAVCGSWKYTNSSAVNDFQQVSNFNSKNEHLTEFLVFSPNGEFKHNFINEKGQVVKTLNGKWKIADDKIKINYTDIDFELSVNFFFLDTNLVLGQNFSHVIFTRDNVDEMNSASTNLASK